MRAVWRLEFAQPPDRRHDWVGPYSSAWLTERAEELVRFMDAEHSRTRPHPGQAGIFAANPAPDWVVCGCTSREALEWWFGAYWQPLLQEGAHVAAYEVPDGAVLDQDDHQVLFRRGASVLRSREGSGPTAPRLPSSAGQRAAIMQAAAGHYDYAGDDHRSPAWQAVVTGSAASRSVGPQCSRSGSPA